MKTNEQLQARVDELETTLAERDRRVWVLEQAKEWPEAGDGSEFERGVKAACDYIASGVKGAALSRVDACRAMLLGDATEASDDGGDVFPQSYVGSDRPHEGIGGGMTLRQHYAGQFAAAWVLALSSRKHDENDMCVAGEANRLGIKQADALLAQMRGCE